MVMNEVDRSARAMYSTTLYFSMSYTLISRSTQKLGEGPFQRSHGSLLEKLDLNHQAPLEET
jgi:hypothetical protein